MNQIPNIEETHNTREVEEIVEKMLAIGWDSKLKKHDGTSIVVSFTKAELCDLLLSIEETHHQQLQKAQQHEQEMYESLDANYQLMLQKAETQAYRRGYKQGRFDNEMDVLRDVPLPNHSELDQDKV